MRYSQSSRRLRPFRPILEALEGRWTPSSFTVSSNLDSGTGTLRDAIMQVNADPNLTRDAILFNLPTGSTTINLATPLPTITHSVVIRGGTQPGYQGQPLVIVNASALPSGSQKGLVVTAGSSSLTAEIDALEIDQVDHGILFTEGSADSSLTLNHDVINTVSQGLGVEVTGGTGKATVVADKNTITADKGIAFDFANLGSASVTLDNNVATCNDGGMAVDIVNDTTITAILTNNHLAANLGGTGVNAFSYQNLNLTLSGNTISVGSGTNHGFGVSTGGTATSMNGTFMNNHISALGGGVAMDIGIGAASTSVNISGNTLASDSGGFALGFGLAFFDAGHRPTSNSFTVQLSNNTLKTQGHGTGLFILADGGFNVHAFGNNFQHNQYGVQIFGDGNTAGVMDFGDSSTAGNNNFSTFKHASGKSFAIGLFSVSQTYVLSAVGNVFSVDPNLVIIDGHHQHRIRGAGTIQLT